MLCPSSFLFVSIFSLLPFTRPHLSCVFVCILFLITQGYRFLPDLSKESETFVGPKEIVQGVCRLASPCLPQYPGGDGWKPPSIYLQITCVLLSLQSGQCWFHLHNNTFDGGGGAPILPSPRFPPCLPQLAVVLVALQWKQMFPLSPMFSVATRSGSLVCYVTPRKPSIDISERLTQSLITQPYNWGLPLDRRSLRSGLFHCILFYVLYFLLSFKSVSPSLVPELGSS